jgi:hypothetical protein
MSIKEAKSNAYAIGMAAVKKSTGDEPPMEKKNVMKAHKIAKKIIAKKKMNEGFNNRHGLSVTASAEKQAVAALNEDDIDSYENRMTAGLGQQYTPYGGGRFGGGAAKTGSIRPRPVRIDNPRIKNTRTGEVSTGTSGPKKRRRLVLKQKQPSAAQQGTMQGQIAKMRQQSGDVAPVRMGMNAADKAKLRIDQAKRSYRTTVQNRPPSQTPSQNIPKPNPQGQGSALPPPKTTSPVIRRGGLSTSRIIKNVAGSAAAGAAVGGAGIAAMSYLNDLGNKPPPAEAKPKGKIYTDRVPEEKPKAQEIPQRKLDTPTRKVTDTEIMNAPQYKQAVKAVGGEASARKIQPGTNVSGIGTVAKGETIWSKVKSQLEKQPAPAPKGFERGNTKGGAGR